MRRLGGHWMRLHPRFISEAINNEPQVQAAIGARLKPGNTFLDIGAYVGLHTLLAAKKVGRSGKVVGFEPSPSNRRLLQYHVVKNRLRNVSVEECVVSDRDGGDIPFFLLNEGDSSTNSITFADVEDNASLTEKSTMIRVPTTTLDAYCLRLHVVPDLIKVDVEGAELSVLRGAARLLREVRPVWIVAVHPDWMPPGEGGDALLQFLAGFGYVVETLEGTKAVMLEQREYLCRPER